MKAENEEGADLMNTYDVCKQYVRGFKREGNNSGGTVYYIGDNIYSYGSHFKMAERMRDGSYIVNGDTYSITTSKHQSRLRDALRGERYVIVPFSALETMLHTISRSHSGIATDRNLVILDTQPEREIEVIRTYYEDGEKKTKVVKQHLLGSSLFQFLGRKFISGLDETGINPWRSYFLTLMHPDREEGVETVKDALQALKPDAVLFAENQGLEVLRQGEWFFIRTELTNKDIREALKPSDGLILESMDLPAPSNVFGGTSSHFVTNYAEIGDKIYAKGTCRHAQKEHKMLKLPGWYEAHSSVQEQSWSAGGRVD